MRREVLVELGTVECLNLVIDDNNATTQWLVHVLQQSVCGAQDVTRDFDESWSDASAHDSLDRGSILRRQCQGVALPVDGCKENCMDGGLPPPNGLHFCDTPPGRRCATNGSCL